jgi:hypothetical protein
LIIITHGGDNVEFEDQKEEISKVDHKKNDDIDQKEEVQTPPVDRFRELMFGTRPSERNHNQQQTNTEMDHEKNDDINQKEKAQTPPVDRFRDFMFGTRSSGRNNDQQQTNTEMDDVNYFTLLGQIDDIMISLKDLKPMLKQISPLIDYIKKKI